MKITSRKIRYIFSMEMPSKLPGQKIRQSINSVVFTNKRSQAEDIYSLFHTKYLEDNKGYVRVQSLSGVQQCL